MKILNLICYAGMASLLLTACKKGKNETVEKQVIVTFNTFGFIEMPSQKVVSGSTLTIPLGIKKNVWVLEGWYKDEACTEKFDVSAAIYKSDTLYAKWKPAFRTVSTFAGDNSGLINQTYGPMTGYTDGIGTNARFWGISGITIDSTGTLYVNEYYNRRVRKISANGLVTTLAGDGKQNSKDGMGTEAEFEGPGNAMAIDSKGNLYIMDMYRLRRISPNGMVTTIAGGAMTVQTDGTGEAASFLTTFGMVCDLQDNIIVAEYNNSLIRKITPGGLVTTLTNRGHSFQDGPLSSAGFNCLQGICRSVDGTFYIADQANHRIRKLSTDGIVSTLAGNGVEGWSDGMSTKATLTRPECIAIDRYGNLYVTEAFLGGSRLRLISPDGYVSAIWAGADSFRDGPIGQALFYKLRNVVIGKDDCIYALEDYNNLVRKISL